MKTVVRRSTFETNSSSTHALILLDPQSFFKWESGEYFLDIDDVVSTYYETNDPASSRHAFQLVSKDEAEELLYSRYAERVGNIGSWDRIEMYMESSLMPYSLVEESEESLRENGFSPILIEELEDGSFEIEFDYML